MIARDRLPTRRGTQGTAHLFFVANLFATLPPIAERIARLRGMA